MINLKVGISFFNSIIGGPREVTRNLLRYIPNIDKNIEYVIFTDTAADLEFLDNMDNVKIIIIKKYGKFDLFLWEQILVYYHSLKEKIDIFHGTKNSIPLLGGFKKICTIHDLAYYIMPDTFSFFQRVHLKISAYITKYFSNGIISVSKNTKKDIEKILAIKSDKIDVIYNSINGELYESIPREKLESIKEKFTLPNKFFLHVGTLQPRKNISTIIEAFVKFKKDDFEDYYLVLAGRKGWYFDKISKQINDSEIVDYVIFTGPVTNEELIGLYNLSYLFIYASNYDGFGLVPLEAMATGTPTISSNISSLPEVIGDAAIGVNPKNYNEIYEGIKLLVNNKQKYEKYSEYGVLQTQKFSWAKSAREYVEMYKNII